MYNINNLVLIIKNRAKSMGISTTSMLENLNLNKNTLSSMNSRGSWIKADSLAKIADYLDCSVDYLLGRTDSPQGISQINTGNVGDNSNVNVHNEKKAADSDDTISELVTEFKNLSFSDKAKVINLVAELSDRGKEE